MPTIYKFCCTTCNHGPNTNSDAGTDSMNPREGGTLCSSGHAAVRLDNGEFVTLGHPGETSQLQELGFTWERAEKERRLYFVHYKICKNCGTFHQERSVHTGSPGCWKFLIALVTGFLVIKYVVGAPWWVTLIGMVVLLEVLMRAQSAIAGLKWEKKNAMMRIANCRRCHGTDFISVKEAKGKNIVCPHCQTNTMHCEEWGYS